MSAAIDQAGLFLPYQRRFAELVMSEPVVVVEKSRRTGLSWMASWVADMVAPAAKAAGGCDVLYMGYNLEMAREFIDYCGEHAKLLQLAASDMRETLFSDPDKPDASIKVFRIDFDSGFKILALPSVPRALRGMQGIVIIDEAAFHDDLEELLKAALALLMWGGRVVIVSTHNGDTNPFAQLVTDILAGRRPYALQRITLDDALADGLYRKICEATGKTWSAEAQAEWRATLVRQYGDKADEELFCIPSPTTGAYLPGALIEARSVAGTPVLRWACPAGFVTASEAVRSAEAEAFCQTELGPVLEALDPKIPCVFGEDFGRSGDLTVIWVLQLLPGLERRTALVLELRNTPFDQQRQILFWLLDRLPRLRAGKMDARGNGQYLAEVTVQRYGARVEAVMLSEPWYREHMPPMKAGLEDAMLSLPADRDIHDDLRVLRLVRGVARVPDSRTADASGQRHGDAAVALALAYAASRAEVEEYGYRAAGVRADAVRIAGIDARGWPIEAELRAEAMRGHGGRRRWGM